MMWRIGSALALLPIATAQWSSVGGIDTVMCTGWSLRLDEVCDHERERELSTRPRRTLCNSAPSQGASIFLCGTFNDWCTGDLVTGTLCNIALHPPARSATALRPTESFRRRHARR